MPSSEDEFSDNCSEYADVEAEGRSVEGDGEATAWSVDPIAVTEQIVEPQFLSSHGQATAWSVDPIAVTEQIVEPQFLSSHEDVQEGAKVSDKRLVKSVKRTSLAAQPVAARSPGLFDLIEQAEVDSDADDDGRLPKSAQTALAAERRVEALVPDLLEHVEVDSDDAEERPVRSDSAQKEDTPVAIEQRLGALVSDLVEHVEVDSDEEGEERFLHNSRPTPAAAMGQLSGAVVSEDHEVASDADDDERLGDWMGGMRPGQGSDPRARPPDKSRAPTLAVSPWLLPLSPQDEEDEPDDDQDEPEASATSRSGEGELGAEDAEPTVRSVRRVEPRLGQRLDEPEEAAEPSDRMDHQPSDAFGVQALSPQPTLTRTASSESGDQPRRVTSKDVLPAVQDGDLTAVRSILNEIPRTTREATDLGEHPLQLASRLGHKRIVDALLVPIVDSLLVADPDGAKQQGKNGFLPIHVAAQNGHNESVNTLLVAFPGGARHQAKNGYLPIHVAATNGHKEIVAALLAAFPVGARWVALNGFLPIHVAAANGHKEVVDELLTQFPDGAKVEDSLGRLPIRAAAANGHRDIVDALLVAFPDGAKRQDMDGLLPIHLAAQNGHKEIVDTLLVSFPEGAKQRAKNGDLPIHAAAISISEAAQLEYRRIVLELLVAFPDGAKRRNLLGMLPWEIATQAGAEEGLLDLLFSAATESTGVKPQKPRSRLAAARDKISKALKPLKSAS